MVSGNIRLKRTYIICNVKEITVDFDELHNCKGHDVATGDVARIGTLAKIGTLARIGTSAILGNDVAFKYF